MTIEVIQLRQSGIWLEALQRCTQYDFYYLPDYHRIAEEHGEGQARLFLYREREYTIALPLLLRSLEHIAGLEEYGAGWWDATSVYGYCGPIVSHQHMPEPVLQGFRVALSHTLHKHQIVTVFSRMHPLIQGQREVLSGIGEYSIRWQTVSIDLTQTRNDQLASYRQGHRYDIRRLRRMGMECIHDVQYEYLTEFVTIYHETMRRVDATASYFFDQHYFKRLSESADTMHLFICRLDGQVACGALIGLCNGIAQYHLAGTADAALRLAPMKLLLDEVRLWAVQQGAHVLHLGGGLGSSEDSLFQFKAGFSNRRHDFAIWRWIVHNDMYDRLSDARQEAELSQGLRARTTDFFPQYRSPAVPITADTTQTAGKE